MKPLRILFMAAAALLVMSSCDDESMKLDKSRISTEIDVDLNVKPTNGIYILQWHQPKYKTDHGRSALSDNINSEQTIYQIYLCDEAGKEPIPLESKGVEKIKNESGEDMYNYIVSMEEVVGLLGNKKTKNFKFGITPINSFGGNDKESIIYQKTNAVTVAVKSSINAEIRINDRFIDPADNDKMKDYNYYVFSDGNYYYYTHIDNYYDDINVHLKASETCGNYKFKQWSDGVQSSEQHMENVKGNVWLEAEYEKIKTDEGGKKYQLTVNVTPQGCGEVKVEGNNIVRKGEEGTVYEYSMEETATITAEAERNYYFECWTNAKGDTVSRENPYSFIVNDTVNLTANFGAKTDMPKEYPGMNTWYILNCKENTSGTVIGRKAMSIVIDGTQSDDDENWDVWSENICCVFQFKEGQNLNDKFHLEFDINWKGENSSKDKVGISLLSGGYRSIDEERNLGDIDELKFPDNSMMQAFVIPLNEEGEGNKRITWDGTIGKEGAIDEDPEAYISVTIHLAGLYGNPSIPNGPGTFTISNMKVLINDKEKW